MSALRWCRRQRACVGASGHCTVLASGRTWTLGINSGARLGSTEVPQIQFIGFVVVEAELEYIIMCQSTEAFGSFVCSFGFARAVRTWKMVHYSPDSCIRQPFPQCLGVACVTAAHWIFPEMTLPVVQCLVWQWIRGLRQYLASGRISHIFYVDEASDFGVCFSC